MQIKYRGILFEMFNTIREELTLHHNLQKVYELQEGTLITRWTSSPLTETFSIKEGEDLLVEAEYLASLANGFLNSHSAHNVLYKPKDFKLSISYMENRLKMVERMMSYNIPNMKSQNDKDVKGLAYYIRALKDPSFIKSLPDEINRLD